MATSKITQADSVVRNDETLTGDPAVEISGDRVRFINAGTVSATSWNSPSILITGAGVKIENLASGQILTGDTGPYMSGTSIRGSAFADTVINNGRISGSVDLGAGNDLFVTTSAQYGNVSMGDGDDVVRVEGTSLGSGYLAGDDGYDTLELTGQVNYGPMHIVGFEALVLKSGVIVDDIRMSGLQAITFGTGGTVTFLGANNPGVDLLINGHDLTLHGGRAGNIVGGSGSEWVTLRNHDGPGGNIVGAIDLGGGNDVLSIEALNAADPLPTAGGPVKGGAGDDLLKVMGGAGMTLDLAGYSGFERLEVSQNFASSTPLRITGAAEFRSITIERGSTVALGGTTLPGAVVHIDSKGKLVLEAGSSIGSVTDFFWSQGFTFLNSGAVIGNVSLSAGDDVYDGRSGSVGGTILAAHGGKDVVLAGSGNNTVYFGQAFTADDRVDGGAGNDTLALQGVYSALTLQAQSLVNVEILSLLTASDNVYGGARGSPAFYKITTHDATVAFGSVLTIFANTLAANEAVHFNGSAEAGGRFFFYGGAGNDSFVGGGGNDVVDGGAGADAMNGGLGEDIYFVDNRLDTVEDAGPGFDALYTTVSFTLSATAVIELLAARYSGDTAGLTLTGNAFAQTIAGTAGADTLIGGGGNDYLIGGDGDDTLYASEGSVLFGGAGNDTYYIPGWGQIVSELAGQGFDRVYVQSSFALIGGVEVEEIIFQSDSGGGVALYGNEFAQKLQGSSLNDGLHGFGGNDVLIGGAGNDSLDGGAGADIMEGGDGDDIYFVDDAGDVVNDGGLPGDFNALYTSVSYVLTNPGIALFAAVNPGGTEAIDLTGDNGTQTIIGNNGANRLLGLGGSDFMHGLDGDDLLDGGDGDDFLEGGAGADTFRFSAVSHIAGVQGDSIRDFVSGTDKIDLSLIDANTGTAGNQAFTYIGNSAFTNQAGQLRYEVSNGQLYIWGDIDGNGTPDFQIIINNTTIVSASDFVL
jgi:Ca2+-binding RTX toxin-like protein